MFNFAIDFELYWGNAYDSGKEISSEFRIVNSQKAIDSLELLRDTMITVGLPATWAVVGKLVEPDLRPPANKEFSPLWAKSDWYAKPATNKNFYEARTFIRDLRKHPLFEIVSHGFAHIEFADGSVTEDIAFEDMKIAKEVLREYVTSETPFIYSSNKIRHTKILDHLGYHIIRGDEDRWVFENDKRLARTPEGFWVSPAMLSLKEAKKLVDEGIRKKGFIHPWTHPRDINFGARDIERFFLPLFEHVKNHEKAGNLEILSFQEIWQRVSLVTSSGTVS